MEPRLKGSHRQTCRPRASITTTNDLSHHVRRDLGVNDLRARLTYANVMATLAFFFAVSGAAAVGASTLLTGADIRDRSITGADVRDHSLSGRKLTRGAVTGALVRNQSLTGLRRERRVVDLCRFHVNDLELLRRQKGDAGPKGGAGPKGDAGSQGAPGPAGPPGSSDITRLTWNAPDAGGYVNGTPLIDQQVPADGGWLMLARTDVSNTGASDDWFDCALVVDGQTIGGGGNNVAAGTTAEIISVAFGPVDASDHVVLACDSGGSSTFDLASIRISLAKLM